MSNYYDQYEARNVTCYLSETGVLEDTDDPAASDATFQNLWGVNDLDAALPLAKENGFQYGWDLSKYPEDGLDIDMQYSGSVSVASNPAGDKQNRNTLALPQISLVKLDCGYWGAYKRWREYGTTEKGADDADGQRMGPQREFGIVCGQHVWKCLFTDHPRGPLKGEDKLDPVEHAAVLRLVKAVKDRDCGIHFLTYARATFDAVEYPDDVLYVCLPDLHLPHKWPDLHPTQERLGGTAPSSDQTEARDKLRGMLLESQNPPGIKYASAMDSRKQKEIQDHIERLHQAGWMNEAGDVDEGQAVVNDANASDGGLGYTVDINARLNPFSNKHTFKPAAFLAEKAIVNRELRLNSTWFYTRGSNWHTPTKDGEGGDASPGVDLVNFLLALKAFKDGEGGEDVEKPVELVTVQLGDLYELWLNHEFLYRDFPVARDGLGAMAIVTQTAINRKCSLLSLDGAGYQYRLDPDGQTAEHGLLGSKRYVFNEWDAADMRCRNHIGTPDVVPPDEQFDVQEKVKNVFRVDRLPTELKRRIDMVEAFALPFPLASGKGPSASSAANGTVVKAKLHPGAVTLLEKNPEIFGARGEDGVYRFASVTSGNYLRANRRGEIEVLWNKLILDTLYDGLGVRTIYGNHDGYRNDPWLNGQAGRAKCDGWLSFPGVWCEHSHRWDEFNRDGVALGAGITNLTYYYFLDLCGKDTGKSETSLGAQEWKCFIPGAAAWFCMANLGRDTADWIKAIRAKVQPFGIYVSGHTHGADLINIKFDVSSLLKAGKEIDQAIDDIGDTIGGAVDEVGDVLSEGAGLLGELIQDASNLLSEIPSMPSAVPNMPMPF